MDSSNHASRTDLVLSKIIYVVIMNTFNFNENKDILRWKTVFELLSLKEVEPFFPKMGLYLDNIPLLRPIAHQFLEKFNERKNENFDEKLLTDTFQNIKNATNEHTAHRIYLWGTEELPVQASDDAHEFIFKQLFRKLAGFIQISKALTPLDIPENKKDFLIENIKKYIGSYNDIEHLTNSLSAEHIRDRVINAIETTNFRSAWNTIKNHLTEEEKDKLLQWGKQQAQELNIPSELVQLPKN